MSSARGAVLRGGGSDALFGFSGRERLKIASRQTYTAGECTYSAHGAVRNVQLRAAYSIA